MDWGFVMGVVTAVLLVAYLGIVLWAWHRDRKELFEEAARYPLFDEEGRS
jgi:cytochrome c oxidase cbb3-type subunit 4